MRTAGVTRRIARAAISAVVLGAIALGAAACGSTSTYRVVTGRAGAPYAGPIAVLLDGAALPPAFAEVAIVQASGHGTHADIDHVFEGLREEAAALGCEAVIRVHIDQGSATASGTGVAVRTTGAAARPYHPPPRPHPASTPGTPDPPAAPVAPDLTAPWAARR